MFKIEEDSLGKLTQFELKNVFTGEYVSIVHDYGTCVNQLTFKVNGKNQNVLLSTTDATLMVGKNWYKGAKMTPYPNRIKNGKFSFNGADYALPITDTKHNNAMHGFVFNKPFEVIGHTEGPDECSVELEYLHNGKVGGFPFPFVLHIQYTFSADGLEVETRIVNKGTTPMPIGDGWHPYFKTGSKIDNLQLTIPECQKIEVDGSMIPTGKLTAYNEFTDGDDIGSTQFDTGFVLKDTDKSRQVTFELYDPAKELLITLWQEAGPKKYNYFQLYTPPDRNSIAIEPMSCAADAFNNGMGLITLKPGEQFCAKYGVIVS